MQAGTVKNLVIPKCTKRVSSWFTPESSIQSYVFDHDTRAILMFYSKPKEASKRALSGRSGRRGTQFRTGNINSAKTKKLYF